MHLNLYNNQSEKNEINKQLSTLYTLEGTLRDKTSILNPIIVVESDNFIGNANYAYIQEFSRYYFITDIKCIRENLFEIMMKVDVLMSFKDDILSSYAIIDKTTASETSYYLPDESWKALVKDKTDIINFSSGLLDSGEYILITAGG